MIWLGSLAIALLISAWGLILAGALGLACVDWYHVTSFEGKSGYFVVGIAVLGAILGLLIATATLVYLRPAHGSGLLHALALAGGLVAVIAWIGWSLAWSHADIPPTFDGQPLLLEVELMLAADSSAPDTSSAPETEMRQHAHRLQIHSAERGTVRASREGVLDVANARLERGRWIVPGSVDLFTRRGRLSVHFQVDGKDLLGFLLPLPKQPTSASFEWSSWSPRPKPPALPWPDSQPSFRVRVRPLPRGE